MSTPHDDFPLLSEIARVLTAAGLNVAVTVRPKDVHRVVIVDQIAGGLVDGPVDDPRADVSPRVQLTTVGSGWEQVARDSRVARQALVGGSYSLPGRKVMWVDQEMTGGIEPDNDVQPPVFWKTEPFRFYTVPA